jgi:hypothetical protein
MHVNRLIKRLIIATFSFLTLYLQANSASISLLPASGLYTVGQNIPITMYVTGNSEAINAVSGQLSFSKDMLQISSIVKDGSIIKLWAELNIIVSDFARQFGRVSRIDEETYLQIAEKYEGINDLFTMWKKETLYRERDELVNDIVEMCQEILSHGEV